MNEHKPKSLKKNYIYNVTYQIFLLITPLLVTPYIARVIGSEGTGKYSFTSSIITYFTLFAALGFNIYGQRIIARNQGNKEKQSKDFWEIVIARLVPVTIAIIVLIACIYFGIFGDYTLLLTVQIITVIAVFFDISFLLQGNEEFGRIVFRNIIIKVLSIASIFLFIKDVSDLHLYVFIQCLSILISNISLWLYLPSQVKKVSVKELEIFKHFKPTLILFLPTIATSIYISLDKTLIGLITGSDIENGNYEYAEKIVKLCMTLFTSLGAVMIPRNAKKFADGDLEGLNENICLTSRFVFLLGIPIVFGLICIAHNMIPWYLGEGYDKAANLMIILSPIVLIIGLSNVIGLQFLIPCGKDKKFTIAIICGAVSNLILNLFLISKFASYGAAIATVIAELIVTSVMISFTRKNIKYNDIIKSSIKYIVAGAVMFIPCYYLSNILAASIINTIIIACSGIIVYGLSLIILKDKFVYEGIKIMKNFACKKK